MSCARLALFSFVVKFVVKDLVRLRSVFGGSFLVSIFIRKVFLDIVVFYLFLLYIGKSRVLREA